MDKIQIGHSDAITLLYAPFICLSLFFCLNFSVNDRWLLGFSVVQNWLWVLRAPDWHSVLCIPCLCLAPPELSCCGPSAWARLVPSAARFVNILNIQIYLLIATATSANVNLDLNQETFYYEHERFCYLWSIINE